MIDKSSQERIRALIQSNIGAHIKIMIKKGRKRVIVRYGTINAVYPFTFNITLESASDFADTNRNASLNYSDVLTGAVSILLTDSGEKIE